jgi:hypothetical protein
MFDWRSLTSDVSISSPIPRAKGRSNSRGTARTSTGPVA